MKNSRGFVAEERPELIEEWRELINGEYTPHNTRAGSDVYIKWRCKKCDHYWSSQVKNRAIHNTGCPKCHERYNVAFPELAIYFYIKRIFKDAKLNTWLEGIGNYTSVDIFIPILNLVIEYDGGHTHRNRSELDKDKSNFILDKGYGLIRIRDNGLPPLEIKGMLEYLYERRSHKSVGQMIEQLLVIIDDCYEGFTTKINEVKTQIDIEHDNIPILAQVPPVDVKEDNLLENCPDIQKVWDYEKNYPFQPRHFKQYSNHKAWFICENKHSTLVQIGSKARGHSCKVCAGQKATEKYNLQLLFPEIAKEWNYKMNNKPPEKYLPFSNEVVYWDCPKCKSTYDYQINWRTSNSENCPYCAGKRVNETNCLATTHPDLIKKWDYKKNKELKLTPYNVTKGQHDKVWWICERNHSYPKMIYDSVGGGGCPTCYNLYGRFKPKKVKREKSLAVKKPEVARQWHPTKNRDVTAYEVGPYAREKYWWLCYNCGHEWLKPPNNRKSARCESCKK